MNTVPARPTEALSSDAVFRVAIEVWIPSDVGYIERVVEIVRRQVAEMSFDTKHVMLNVPVALTEALRTRSCAVTEKTREARPRPRIGQRRAARDGSKGRGARSTSTDVQGPNTPENVEREDGVGCFCAVPHGQRRALRSDGNVVA